MALTPVLPSVPEFEPPLQDDPKAAKESVEISDSTLEESNEARDSARKHRFRDNVISGMIWIFWVAVVLAIIGLVTYVFHLVTPKKAHYLEQDQLEAIKTALVVVWSSIIAGYAGKQMQDD